MDIREIKPKTPAAPEATRRTQSTGAPQGSPRGLEHSTDRVTVSDQAQNINHARQAALAVPEVRQDRVEAIKQQLANGTLRPDASKIAKTLINQGILQ